MNARRIDLDDSLDDFRHRTITLDGVAKPVYVGGVGPAVIVISEMPGISPHVARFARWVRDAGFTCFLPSLFGVDGAVADAERGADVFRRACVSAEFRAFGAGVGASSVTAWLRGLARLANEECGGGGVGAIGMCFTGNFAVAMMIEPAVVAPVVAQPALPMDDLGGLELSSEELAAVKGRLERDDLVILGYRFAGDQICRAERFAAYRQVFGDRFLARELPDSAANMGELPSFFSTYVDYPHSVFTVHLVDEDGSPTRHALAEVLEFFAQRLMSSATRPDEE